MNIKFRGSKFVLILAWATSIAILIVISIMFAGESTRFFGIADDQEQVIRFTSAVEITNYGFVPGQAVSAGDLIVEVRKPELESEQQIIDERIQGLKFGNRESRASMESEIVRLQADLQATVAELDSDIETLHARQNAADNILSKLEGDGHTVGRDAIRDQITSLTTQKRALSRASNARIHDLQSRLSTPERAIDAQIAELENRQREFARQQGDLDVRAQFDGRVGSVLFKIGDTVAPYQPVLTVHGTRPSFIKGYIHENANNDVQNGQSVWIRSSNSTRDDNWIEGVVEGLGSRIVEFPARLKVNPMSQAWGREVTIQITAEHSLLLGEKVSVQIDKPITDLSSIKTLVAKVLP